MENKLEIYRTTNTINGKFYIGKTTKPNSNYLGSGRGISNAIKKYGKQNFKYETLEVCNDEVELNEKEIYWIDKLNAYESQDSYNSTRGGEGGDTLSNHPRYDEIGKKISEYHTGKPKSKQHIENMSKALKGRDVSWGSKISKTMSGRIQEKVVCPHCSLSGGKNNMTRYHFDNCKENNNVKENGFQRV